MWKHDATVLTEIGYIKANTDEIKAEQKEQSEKTNTELVTRLTDAKRRRTGITSGLTTSKKRMDRWQSNTAAAGASPPLLHCKGGFSNEQ